MKFKTFRCFKTKLEANETTQGKVFIIDPFKTFLGLKICKCVCVWCGVSVCKCKWGDLKPTHFHPPGATALLELAQNEMIKKPMERD